MSYEIRVPELGESIAQATVGSWLKRPGDTVASGDPVVELETEKVTMEIVATDPGILDAIHKQEGDTVAIGDLLGIISDRIHTGSPSSSSSSSPEGPEPAP